jgi:hypothetical protein
MNMAAIEIYRISEKMALLKSLEILCANRPLKITEALLL